MTATVAQVRLLLWELDETTSILTNGQIEAIIAMSGTSIARAAAIGWSVKGGYYSDQIDTEESGSSRLLSQLYRNAERHWQNWSKKADAEEAVSDEAISRVVGHGFKIFGDQADTHTISIFHSDQLLISMNTREFPLKRFPAIL